MKVLNIYRTYFPDPPGGLQEAIRQACLATSNHGVENTIFTLSPNNQPRIIEMPEAAVVRERSWMAPASCDIGGIASFKTFAQLTSEADVLHHWFPWPFADVLKLLTSSDKPLVLTYISDVVRQRWLGAAYAPLMWHTLKQARVVVANSPAYAQTSPVLSHPSIRDKVRVIPLGIEEISYSKEGDNAIFDRLAVKAGEPYFLFIGVLRYYKGLQFLLKAAKMVNAKIIIAGSGFEGANLQVLAINEGVDNVIFAGQVSDAEKIALLKQCCALVLPSHLRSEAYGMVLVEATMFGRPMISCEIGTGTSYVNKHEETGIVVEPESPSALAVAMNTLLNDETLVKQMGEAARNRYETLFSGPALGHAYAELFREVAGLA